MPDYSIEEYVTTVDYSSSVASLIERYGYTLTNYTYNERGFKSNDTRKYGRVTLKMVVVRFNIPVSREIQAANVLRYNNLRSATLKELMALGSGGTAPHIYSLNNIISLEKIQNPFGGEWAYPHLFSPRLLGAIWYLNSSTTDWHFAAVRI